jgi:hypothetical protein
MLELPHLENCVYASEMKWMPLSVRHIVGDPWRTNTRFVASITKELCKPNSKKSLYRSTGGEVITTVVFEKVLPNILPWQLLYWMT